MLRKTAIVALTTALMLNATGAVFAQDGGGNSIYLPVVRAAQQDETEQDVDAAGDHNGDHSKRCGSGRGGEGWGKRQGKLEIVGLTADLRLLCFDEKNPKKADTIGTVNGLVNDSSLVGIDFRPATGELYAVGNAGGIYTLSLMNAQATLRSTITTTLSGSSFGVDFNPTVDRLRIISDNGQNLRVNVDTGATLVDGTLAYTAGTPANGMSGAAYTNNDSDPNTATTLFDIDSILDQVAIQSPANSGQLAATGKLTVDTTTAVGFDIYSAVKHGTTEDVRAFASLSVNGQSSFYRVNLLTGKASEVGAFRSRNQVIGIAIPVNQ